MPLPLRTYAIAAALCALTALHVRATERSTDAASSRPLRVAADPSDSTLTVRDQLGGTGHLLLPHEGSLYADVGPRIVRLDPDDDADTFTIGASSPTLDGLPQGLARGADGTLYASVWPDGMLTLADRGDALEITSRVFASHPGPLTVVDDELLMLDYGHFIQRSGGIDVYDITPGAAPSLRERIALPIGEYPGNHAWLRRMTTADGRTYVAYEDDYGGSFIAVLAEGENGRTKLFSHHPIDALNVYDMHVVADRLFLIDQYTIKVFDLSNPVDMTMLHELDPTPDYYPIRMAADESLLAVATSFERNASDRRQGLFVLDAREPSGGLPELAFLEVDPPLGSVELVDGIVYGSGTSAGGSSFVRAHDLDQPSAPEPRFDWEHPGIVQQVATNRDRAVAVGSSDVWELSIHDGKVRARHRVDLGDTGNIIDMVWVDGYLITLGRTEGIRITDVTQSGASRPVASIPRDSTSNLGPRSIAVYGEQAYVIDARGQTRVSSARAELRVIDIADPESPQVGVTTTVPAGAFDMAIVGDRAALVADALHIMDLSDPDRPAWLAELPLAGDPVALDALDDDRVLVATDDRLSVIDITEPDAPQAVGAIDVQGVILTAATDGTSLFAEVAASAPPASIRLVRYDVLEDDTLREADSVDLGHYRGGAYRPRGLGFMGDHVLVPQMRSGLSLVETATQPSKTPVFLPKLFSDWMSP